MIDLHEASLNRLAGVLAGYLRGETWATDNRLNGEVFKSHDLEELRSVLSSPQYAYLRDINPERFENLKKMFL